VYGRRCADERILPTIAADVNTDLLELNGALPRRRRAM
jgi:hypothetical protein